MKYKISKEALEDLENIWLYTFEKWSFEQADRYINSIMDEIEFVSLNPKVGKDYNHIRKSYYRTRIKSHFIFYKFFYQITVLKLLEFYINEWTLMKYYFKKPNNLSK